MMSEQTPSEYLCPISMEVMKDPVVLCEDGHTYDRAELEKWLQQHNTSPMTNRKLTSQKFVPNYALKSLISSHTIVDNNFYSFSIKPGSPQNPNWAKLPKLTLQLCLIGESGVGKTSLITALEYNTVPATLQILVPTVGCECKFFHLDRLFQDKYVVTIRIDDTAGQERYRSITPMFIRQANGILFVTDATHLATLSELEKFWLQRVREVKTDQFEAVLICNKLDSFENCQGDYRTNFLAQATEIATRHEMSLFSTSAHRGDNVHKSVKNLLLRIFKNDKLIEEMLRPKVKLPLSKPTATKSGCCS